MGSSRRSPEILKRIVEQGADSPSFEHASRQLKRHLRIDIGDKEVERLTEQLGRHWAEARDKEVEQFKQNTLPRSHAQAPDAAAVMVDGGRTQIREADSKPGAHQPHWREVKYGNLATIASRPCSLDPQPEPPSKLLQPDRVKKLVDQLSNQAVPTRKSSAPAETHPRRRRQRKKLVPRITRLITTFVATLQNATDFGYMMAAEAHRRSLDLAKRKAFVCDGLPYNWTIYETHFRAWGFTPILDFLHLVVYLYAAAHALHQHQNWRAWPCYERWLRWAWSGNREALLAALQAASATVGLPPKNAAEQDHRLIIARALDYVTNNYDRIDYPRYRKLGLPCSSAPVESTVKQFSRRLKGTEKFWLEGGAEAVAQVRAACISQDGRAAALWQLPQPYRAYGLNWARIAA
ncbi:MAG TPA: hypothetical protein VGP72_07330 [Planctomycetota bacterium]